MEDIRRRTDFQHIGIQIQAMDKLYNEMKKKRPGGQQLSKSTPEFVELKTLWQYTGDVQGSVARHACRLLTQLLRENGADFTYILNGFLNQVPTARNLQGIIEGVTDLLELQIVLKEGAGEKYSCPYSIRNPPHPFITILVNRPEDSWPLLLDQVSAFFSHQNQSVSQNAIECLDPFLKFILLDPKESSQFVMIKTLLKTTLIDNVNWITDKHFKNRCFEYLLQLIKNMQLSTRDQIGDVTHFCVQLLSLYQNQMSAIEDSHGESLGIFAIALALKCHHSQLGMATVCKKLIEIAKEKPQVLANDYNLTVLSELILMVYPADNIYILNIVKLILKSSSSLSPLCCGFVHMGVINMVAGRTTDNMPYHKSLVTLATDIIAQLQQQQKVTPVTVEDVQLTRLLTPEVYNSQVMVQLARNFYGNTALLEQWLGHLKVSIQSMTDIPLNLTNLLVSVMIQTDVTSICKLAVTCISEISKQQPSQAPSFLPVFLFSLNKKPLPEQKLCIMEALPSLASHKYCVPPVLKVIQSLGLNPKLKGLTIKLLTDLWKIQSRCFPMLLNAITEDMTGHQSISMATLTDDIVIAKAAAIKEICQLKPEQHGTEVLAPLSNILDSCTDERGGPASALALEALYYICQAEVIDIISTWKVLESKLLKETRPIVKEKICDLLSLVPQLPASSQAYQEFLEQTVRILWQYTQSDNSKVVVAAFQSLSHFGTENFKLSHLKYKIVEEFVQQAQAILEQTEDNPGETVDSLIPTPPGVCYIRLLQDQNKQTIHGFESFLSSLVGREFESLPRGIYYSATRRHGSSARLGKAVASVPTLIQTQYENTNQPGLRPGLAAGLLFCYDPPVSVSRDGRPRLHYTMSHGKNYQQMFQSLLNDVSVPATEWHMMALMPMAWSLFVERLFGSMVMARKAEIDLQRNRDFIDETEAAEKKCLLGYGETRDTIVDVIKRASKGNPSVQANAILALSGLVATSHRYVISLDREERRHLDDITDHMTHSHWTMTVIDSCLSIIDFTYKPKSPLIGLCQQRSVDDRLPASILAQGAGILALSQLVPVLVSHYVETVYLMLDKLIGWLPGQPDDDECPPVLHLCRGIAIGKFLGKLVNESFVDMESSKGSLAVMKGFDALEKCCFSQSPHRLGPMVGLGICLSALSQDGKTDSRVHVGSVLNTMLSHLKGLPTTDTVYKACSVSVAMVTSTGFTSNAVDMELVDMVLNHLLGEVKTNNQDVGAALSFGLLCHSLMSGGHPNVVPISQSMYSDWMNMSHDKDAQPMGKLAALTGLLAITGSEKLLVAVNNSTTDLPAEMKIDTVIKTACQLMTSTDDVIAQGSAAWLLGNFYLSLNASPQSSSTVPTNYSYLPETSILKAIVEFLLQACKQGPESIASEEVAVCLKALEEEVTGSLPPLNWTGVLSPLLKLPFSEEVKIQCISLATKQCLSSSTAALFLSSWCVPPLFNTLSKRCQLIILSNCVVLMKSITPTIFQNFLDKSCFPMISTSSKGKSLRIAALKGLNSALRVSDPPESTVSMLFRIVTKLYGELKAESDMDVLRALSECLGQLPVQMFDDITNGDCTDYESILRGSFVRCYLVGAGKQPIALLNSCIDAAFNNDCDHEGLLYYLTVCFYLMTQSTESVHTRVMQRVQWLLEIMGHVRNIATGTYPVKLPIDKVIEFAVNIVSAAICGWTTKASPAVFNLDTTFLKPSSESEPTGLLELEPDICHYKVALQPLSYLRGSIGNFGKEPWSQILPKVLDWLLTLIDLPDTVISRNIKGIFKDCVHGLRSNPDFSKVTVWTRAVQQT